ncbi:MAG: hypothetical protein COB36_14915 [Alphaproteobacteria bacterium]|nr:MAG: hypothetical protein COB36_14915 [Alphaproteobacteria bacterium]
MRLYEIYSNLNQTKRTSVLGIPSHANYDYRLGPMPQTDIERKLDKMEREIKRDHTERDIDVPLHMRNEYFDDSYEELVDDETESHLLDRDVNRVRMMLRGVQPPALPYPSRRPG